MIAMRQFSCSILRKVAADRDRSCSQRDRIEAAEYRVREKRGKEGFWISRESLNPVRRHSAASHLPHRGIPPNWVFPHASTTDQVFISCCQAVQFDFRASKPAIGNRFLPVGSARLVPAAALLSGNLAAFPVEFAAERLNGLCYSDAGLPLFPHPPRSRFDFSLAFSTAARTFANVTSRHPGLLRHAGRSTGPDG